MAVDGTPIAPPRVRIMTTVSRLVSGLLLLLGILGILRTEGQGGTYSLTIFTVHPLTGVAWTVLGLVGIAMGTTAERTYRFLVGAGALLVAWAGLGLVLDGRPSDVFVRDLELIVLNGMLGLLALAAALTDVPARLVGLIE